LLKGYGNESRSPRRPVDPESTLFNVASVSKLFTTTAALQLVDQQRLALDEDVSAQLGRGVIEGDGPAITLRQLLTHTSGLDGAFMRDVVSSPSELLPLADYFRRYPVRRSRPPGQEIRYSNVGMALVGRLVEIGSGVPFERYVEDYVLGPLGMRRSTFRQPPPGALASRVATYGSGPVPDALLLAPAGAMVSTAGDMARFLRAQMDSGPPGPAPGVTPLIRLQLQRTQWSADPAVPGVGFGFLQSDLGGVPGVFHTGARTHFSLLYLVPSEHLGVFVVHAMRQGGPHQTLRTDFVRALIERYTSGGRAYRVEPEMAQARGWPQLSAFVGAYRPSLLASTNLERAAQLGLDTPVRLGADRRLTAKMPGGPRLTLRRIGPAHFRVANGPQRDLHVVFKRDAQGTVTGFAMSGSTQDPLSFTKLAWYRRGMLHAALLGTIALLFVLTALAAPFGAVGRWRRSRRPGVAPEPRPWVWAWRAAVVTGVFTLAAPLTTATLVMTHAGEDTAADGLRFALTVGLTSLLLAMLVGTTLPPLAVVAWRRRYWGATRRAYFTVLAAGVLIAVPLLYHYHLLGYWV
jgi:CubicO group peptidase (beta-lactamase class C family)